jgi:excisionase family DNA binding protein
MCLIYIYTSDVAKAFGVEVSTIYRWVDSGKLPKPIRLGGMRWNRDSFVEWVNSNHPGVILPTANLGIDIYDVK